MARACVIYPIPLFRTTGDMSRVTWRFNIGKSLALVNYVWYIAGTSERILVDAGGSSDYFSRALGTPVEYIQTVDMGLSKLGVAPQDINLVIVTHLHFDHIAHASLFTKAKILVQSDELEFALNPQPMFAPVYPRQFIDGVKFEPIEGDIKISEEVSVVRTPGHSPGGQSVLVNTAQGVAAISGICTCRENFVLPPPLDKAMRVIIPTMHTNPIAAYESMLKIKEMARIVVPNHDLGYEQCASIP